MRSFFLGGEHAIDFALARGLSSSLSNVGVIPLDHPSYDACSSVLPLSVCFGLLSASSPADESDSRAAVAGMLSPTGAFKMAFEPAPLAALCCQSCAIPASSNQC